MALSPHPKGSSVTGRHKILPILLSLIVSAAASGQPSNPSLREQLWLNTPAIEESEFEMLLTIVRLRQDLLIDEDSQLFTTIINANPEAFGLTQADLREMRENPFALLDSKPEIIQRIVKRAENASVNYFITQYAAPGRSALGEYDFEETRFVKSSGRTPYFELDAVWRRRTRTLPFESLVSPAPFEISKIEMSRDDGRKLMDWLGGADSAYASRLTTRWEYRIDRIEPGTRPGRWIAHIRPRTLTISAERRLRLGLDRQWETMNTGPFYAHEFTAANAESVARAQRSALSLPETEINRTANVQKAIAGGYSSSRSRGFEGEPDLFRMLRPTNEFIDTRDAAYESEQHLLGTVKLYDDGRSQNSISTGKLISEDDRRSGSGKSIFSDATVYQTTDDRKTTHTISFYADPGNPESVFYFLLRMQYSSRLTDEERQSLIDRLTAEWGPNYIQYADSWIWSADPAAVLRAKSGLPQSGVHCLEEIRLSLPRSTSWNTAGNRIVAPTLQAARGPGDDGIQSGCPPLIHVRMRNREIQIQRYDAQIAVDANRRLDDEYLRRTRLPRADRVEELFDQE